MKLEELVEDYLNNPEEELKELIIEQAKKTSRLSIIHIIDTLSKKINENNKEEYLNVCKLLLDEISNENIQNKKIDEYSRLIPVEEPKKKKN